MHILLFLLPLAPPPMPPPFTLILFLLSPLLNYNRAQSYSCQWDRHITVEMIKLRGDW